MEITRAASLRGTITVPGDKSISHRAVMIGSLAKGTTEILNFLNGADCLSTIDCFRRLGVEIKQASDRIVIQGKGLHGLLAPNGILDTGNSGTTTRMLSGILAGQSFVTDINGDESIQKRPMKRIIDPLTLMGADIHSLADNGCAPLRITGRPLKGIHYTSKVASAQVKSAILLAGLYADSPTSVTEPYVSRNHSEIMLNHFGGSVTCKDTTALIQPNPPLCGQKVMVPGDISSAAYFIAAGLLVPDSQLLIKNVGINETRDGILKVCHAMGADITLENVRKDQGEPTADILVRTSHLRGCTIEGSMIPTLIDELPIIAILACFAEGATVIRDAAELKVKESNRIDVMVQNLREMGAEVQATDDGMSIQGGRPLLGTVIDSHLDHRIAMSFAIAGLCADGTTTIKGSDCVNISYPGFYQDLSSLRN